MPRKLLETTTIRSAAENDAPSAATAKEAERLERWARQNGFGRTLAWQAAHPDPSYRRGLPFLPTFTVGRCRMVLLDTGKRWLRELERSAAEQAPERPAA